MSSLKGILASGKSLVKHGESLCRLPYQEISKMSGKHAKSHWFKTNCYLFGCCKIEFRSKWLLFSPPSGNESEDQR